ncbi:MAG: hypothetical protein DRP87_15125 [Spirochaetes bacterium]|nr:MAG: hypothetical protein DRP87_15125 [Spirochaetota bacterium]
MSIDSPPKNITITIIEAFLKSVKILENVVKVILIIDITGMIFLMTMQIINRYLFKNPLIWTEELARYFFVWGTILGATIALRKYEMVGVNFIIDKLSKLSPKIHKLLRSTSIIAVAILFFYFARYGYSLMYTAKMGRTISAALQAPMYIVYLIFPVGGTIMVIFSIACFLEILTDKAPNMLEQTEAEEEE